jgi:hypothetical protein
MHGLDEEVEISGAKYPRDDRGYKVLDITGLSRIIILHSFFIGIHIQSSIYWSHWPIGLIQQYAYPMNTWNYDGTKILIKKINVIVFPEFFV